MHVAGKCKMGISFWPSFRFKAPDREAEPGAARLIYGSPATAPAPASPEAAGPHTQAGSSSSSPGGTSTAQQAAGGGERPLPGSEAVAEGGEPARQLLHISFTKDPPDEFNVGANFMCGIPFPFITIRTNKLEGTLDPETGAVTLLFEASFLSQVGKKEPTSLEINATLTTEPAHAFKTTMQGQRLTGGQGVLVSAAEVPKTPSWFANLILWLPTAATAKLPVRFEFS